MTSSFAAFASQMLNRPSPSANSNEEPMFFSFTSGGGGRSVRLDDDDDEEDPHLRETADPYLKLDDYDEEGAQNRYEDTDDEEDYPEGGWLAHQASPLLPSSSSPSPPPLPPPPRTQSSLPGHKPQHGRNTQQRSQQQHISMTASLLPPTSSHPGFSLPLTPSRRPTTYNDFPYTVCYLVCFSACLVACIVLLFSKPPNRTDYKTLLHTIPLLTILTVLAALLSYLHLFLLKVFARPALLVSSLLVPTSLVICALWAFVGSFTYQGQPTWGESTGLRLFSLVPLVLAFFAFRNLDHLPRDIQSTTSMLELIVRVLRANPLLLGVSPALLVAMWVASIPFVTILFRADMRVGWGTIAVVATWLWTWGVARGLMRVAVAGVVGSHYFNPRVGDTRPLHAAAHRATQASLGSVIVASLILTVIRLLGLCSILMGRLPVYTSIPFVISFSRFAVMWLDSVTTSLSKFALTWVGLTGEPFFTAARRSQAISVETMKTKLARPPSLRLLLTTPITLPLPAFLVLYLFVAHTLDAPNKALGVAVMGGGATLLSAWMCVGLVRDVGDSLWVVWCIDNQEDSGSSRRNEEWRQEVAQAFEYKPSQPNTQPIRRFPPPDPSQSTMPVYSPPRTTRELQRSPTPPPLIPQPQPRYSQHYPKMPVQPTSARPAEPPSSPPVDVDVDDLDPFETETEAASHSRIATSRSQSQILAATRDRRLPDSDSEEEGEMDGVFPGSGLFGSGLA